MIDGKDKMIYYVSNLGTDTVSIIDSDGYHIIKEVEIGPRPQNIVIDEKKNVYIASDRNSRVTIIQDLYDCSKTWYMPNNGNIKVDSIAQRIYVCNTDEVCIYSLVTGEKISSLKGFVAADDLELDKNKRRLFVLDVLQNEIKVYDTLNFQLIKLYKNVADSPKCIFLEETGEKIYIANKGNDAERICILNIENGGVFHIDLEKGSIITALEGNGITLYAANSGLHRVEVIDTLKKKCLGVIKTTLPKIQKLRLSPDKQILLVTSQNMNGKGGIDRIDISRNSILDTFIFEKNDTFPYNIGVIAENNVSPKEELPILNECTDKLKKENGINILAKRIISSYQEKIIFHEVSIALYPESEGLIKIEEIAFKRCEIINETKKRQVIETQKEDSIFQYDFYIPYCILYIDEQEQKYIVEGKIEGKEEAELCISSHMDQQEIQFVINSFTKIIDTPALIGKNLQFDVEVLISTKAIVEEIVFVPSCNNCNIKDKHNQEK